MPKIEKQPAPLHSPQRRFRSNRLLRVQPMTIAPPISGELVHTATNQPEVAASWQNEPGPGAGEAPEYEIARRPIAAMESVPRVKLPPVWLS